MLPARGDAVVQERSAVRELAAASRCNTRRDRHHQGTPLRAALRGYRCRSASRRWQCTLLRLSDLDAGALAKEQ